jgi:hypothetical protein
VLPMTSFHIGHHLKNTSKEAIKKIGTEETTVKSLPPPTIQCTVEEVNPMSERNSKKTKRRRLMKIQSMKHVHFTMSALRWIFLIIFIYLAAGTIVVMIHDGTESIKNIVVYSIIGFFTFFMGYLGWILARDVLDMVLGKKASQNEAEVEA